MKSNDNLPDIHPEILHLLKSGSVPTPTLQKYMKELQQPEYPMDFVAFMDQMIRESGMDRKTVIARSGLSESLAYKYLNGNKKTTERDYILALCLAMHLNFPQTQHALRCSGLPLLGPLDLRAIIIRMGIEDGLDMYRLNEHLNNAGFPLIKISNDMPTAEIRDSMYGGSNPAQRNETDGQGAPTFRYPRSDAYEEVESHADASHCGNAPFDFNYYGSTTLKDKTGKTYHLEAMYLATGESSFMVMDDEQFERFKPMKEEIMRFDAGNCPCPDFSEDEWMAQLQAEEGMPDDDFDENQDTFADEEDLEDDEAYDDEDGIADDTGEDNDEVEDEADWEDEEGIFENDPEAFMECYPSLLAATASAFFPWFMDLDHLTDKKVAEVLANVNDTRNMPYRCGAHWTGSKPEIYIEMFNNSQPEKREYYQLIENSDHECTYSASHESYFMQIETDDFYEAYFTKNREPEYFLKATDADFEKLDKRYQMIFNSLRHFLHNFARTEKTFVEIPDSQFYEEESEFFAEMFITCMHAEDYLQARIALEEQEKAIRACHYPEAREMTLLTVTDLRKYHLAQFEEKVEEAERLREAILCRKDDALRLEKELGEDADTVFTILADVQLDRCRELQREGKDEHRKEDLEELLDLMRHGAFSDEEGRSQERFEIYQGYAFIIDEESPEKAEQYYLKAIKEATKHHLDQVKYSAAAVANVYNNYAWLLWNKLGSEEAIVYYGRAIELAETFLDNGMLTPDHARRNLQHYGEALLNIYRDTARDKEHNRLCKRLKRNGVILED